MKKNILFVIPWLPYPMKSGGHQALFNGIAAVKDDFNIYLTYEAWEGEEYRNAEEGFLQKIPQAQLLPLVRSINLNTKAPLPIRILRKVKKIVYRLIYPHQQKTFTDNKYKREQGWIRSISPLAPDFIEHVHSICNKYKFEIIQVEMPWLISMVFGLPKTAKKVYVHHELGFVRRELEIKNNPSAYTLTCKAFADLNEIAQLNLYDTIITLSSIDTDKLKKAGVSVPVKSSFAIIDSITNPEIATSNGKVLTFIGPDNHNPNYIGITWFLENCWGKLKDYDKEYRLNIIGKWSDKHIQEITEKYADITFLGFVSDLNCAIIGTIMIVPITIGSGIRMKILEACSKGIPFVSTAIGAEGIPVENGKDCFVTDDPDEFVKDIIELQATDLQIKFIKNSNTMVRNLFSSEALRQNRASIYKYVLNS